VRATPSAREIPLLLRTIDQAYDHASWHGTNLRGSVRRVSPAQAAWRPAPRRHNIWELVVHAAYWKYAVWRRLTGQSRGSFPLKGSNWFERPAPGADADRAWRGDVALLDRMHGELRAAIARLPARDLHRTPGGSKVSNFALISGVAAHDLYHAGQIQLLKRLSATTAS
jgi:DinB family protein